MKMIVCVECNTMFLTRPNARGGHIPRTCGQACRTARARSVKREYTRAGFGKGETKHKKRNPMFELGPEVPLDGISDEQRRRMREERIRRAVAEGLSTHALRERFGYDAREEVISEVREQLGIDAESGRGLAAGLP